VIAAEVNAAFMSGCFRIHPKEQVMVQEQSTQPSGGLIVARNKVMAARARSEQPSDGGSSGVSDTND
jgi:hypothetical protein